MDFKQLRYFMAVVEEGSISAAAISLPLAQPALTRQLQLLEERRGVLAASLPPGGDADRGGRGLPP
ncbi:helix-turn-helix domain-containing protein [Salinicola tamaricis]|uniref:helix-turn-helix domain-containing protein n=1 Tax=Salinicola tamaricis TaxID=1771309 RepID=UPI00101AD42B|nr:LysR family transcriptional regulator [Salinicola tamaricis]